MDQERLNGALIRGGTSKGLFVREQELPSENRDDVLLAIYGSPDPRQINGIGGATTTTSKLIIAGPPRHPDADVSYTFGQVSITESTIDYDGNCGNMTFGVGAFAVDEGLVEPDPDAERITIRLHNTNTDVLLDQTVPLSNGRAATKGDFKVHGVPGTGARVDTTFLNPGGAFTGDLFPLGAPKTDLEIDGEPIEVSVVDVTTPVVFVHAETLGLSGTEAPAEMNADESLLNRMEAIRGVVCAELGLVSDPSDSASQSPNYPKFAFVNEPTDYRGTNGNRILADDIDLVARVSSMPVMHPVYAVTSASCTAAAVNLPGTIPYEVATHNRDPVTFGHPQGTMSIGVDVEISDNESVVNSVTVGRTQRRIMEGNVFY